MTGKELEVLLAEHTSLSASFLEHVGRAMRAADMLPTGGRGLHAPDLTAGHVANYLLGVTTADISQQAAEQARKWANAPVMERHR